MAGRGRTTTRIEQMLDTLAPVCSRRQEILGLLLETMAPPLCQGRPVLRPIWANEAMQRAYELVRLVARLEQSAPLRRRDGVAARAERRLARELAATFRALDVIDDATVLPCSDVLRTLVRDLVELFGPPDAGFGLRTFIEPVTLPALKRRALVLAACALVIDAMGGDVSDGGVVTVTLARMAPTRALLRVADTGWRARGGECGKSGDVLADLAALLDSEPVRQVDGGGGVAVEIVFSLS